MKSFWFEGIRYGFEMTDNSWGRGVLDLYVEKAPGKSPDVFTHVVQIVIDHNTENAQMTEVNTHGEAETESASLGYHWASIQEPETLAQQAANFYQYQCS